MNFALTWQLKWLWLKRTARFNWAHKPLCDRFEQDVIHLFGFHVCRSCTAVYLGLLTACVGLALGRPEGASLFWPGIALSAIVFPLSAPGIYKRWPRLFRDLLRFSVGALFPVFIYLGVSGHAATAVILLLLLGLFWRFYFALRGKQKSRACNGCEHLGRGAVCPGYALQASAIRGYEEEATRCCLNHCPNLFSRGFLPKCRN